MWAVERSVVMGELVFVDESEAIQDTYSLNAPIGKKGRTDSGKH